MSCLIIEIKIPNVHIKTYCKCFKFKTFLIKLRLIKKTNTIIKITVFNNWFKEKKI